MTDLARDVAQFLSEARELDQPSAGDEARVAERLAATLGFSGGAALLSAHAKAQAATQSAALGASASASASASAGTFTLAKVGFVIGALALAGAGVYALRVVVEQAAPAAPRADDLNAVPRSVEPAVATVAQAAPSTASHAPVANVQPEAPRAVSPNHERSNHTERPRDTLQAPAPAYAATASTGTGTTMTTTTTPAATPSGSAPPTVLRAELELIDAASRALDRGNPLLALELTTRHRQRYAAGFLTEERSALEIMALCQLGRSAEAASLRANFERRAPRSPLRLQIAARCTPRGD